jgi:acetylornithine deacetylase
MDEVDDAAIVRDLAQLVAIASVDGSREEPEAQRWCAERLAEVGFDVDCWDIDVEEARSQPDFPGMEVERAVALGCVGWYGDTGSIPGLALYGHSDVVPAGDLDSWSGRDPFRMRVVDAPVT